MASSKQMLKTALRQSLHGLGAISLLRELRRSGVRILTYHHFHPGDSASFEQQCRLVCAEYHPLSLAEVEHAIHSSQALPPKAVVITVDDGYRDFLTEAFPILERYRIPSTVFLVSDFLDGTAWLWTDIVPYAFQHTARREVSELMQGLSPLSVALRLGTEEDRRQSASRVVRELKGWPDQPRRAFVGKLLLALDVSLPQAPPSDLAPLTWDEVRNLAKRGVTFGAHSKTHPILPRVESDETLRLEVECCKQRIEQELGQQIDYFCYPNGDWDERVLRHVSQAGYSLAVTTRWGRNLAASSPWLLERSPADPQWPFPFFRESLAYGYPWRPYAPHAGGAS